MSLVYTCACSKGDTGCKNQAVCFPREKPVVYAGV